MKYIGLDKQISRNNRNSLFLLIAFPALLLAMVYAAVYFLVKNHNSNAEINDRVYDSTQTFIGVAPMVLAGVAI